MIAATAIAEDLPLFTTNPDDYAGLERLVRVIPVTRPHCPTRRGPDLGGSRHAAGAANGIGQHELPAQVTRSSQPASTAARSVSAMTSRSAIFVSASASFACARA